MVRRYGLDNARGKEVNATDASGCWSLHHRHLLALAYFSLQGKGNFDPAHELEEILLEDNPLRAKRRTKDFEAMSPEMKRMEEQCVTNSLLSVQTADLPIRFLPYDFRQTVHVQSNGSPSGTSAIPHRPTTPGTPIIDRGFENMIDHKSIINQAIDSPVGKRHGDNASVETHELNPRHSPLPNGTSSPAEETDNPLGEPKQYLMASPTTN